MKLRNKKTGEILKGLGSFIIQNPKRINCESITKYDSLAELNEDWEDYEEPKDTWCIDYYDVVKVGHEYDALLKEVKLIGNYFETKEEAKQAVKKLKAWKRLKDKHFKFYGWNKGSLLKSKPNTIEFACDDTRLWSWEDIRDDLDLLFGGEE